MKKIKLINIIFIIFAIFAVTAFSQTRPKKQSKSTKTTDSDTVWVFVPAQSLKPVSDKNIFGFEFGKPLKEIRGCGIDEIRRGLYFSTCAKFSKLEANDKQPVYLGTTDYGLLVKGEEHSINITVVENKLEAVSWETDKGTQTVVMDALVSKYGEPHKQENHLPARPGDSKYDFLKKAEWNFSDLKISYQTNSSYDSSGNVIIETPTGEKYNKETPKKQIPPVKF